MEPVAPVIDIPGLKMLSQIGAGGMAKVWKAWDFENNRYVAVKILNRDLSSQGSEIRAMRIEEKMMEEIHHRGIVEAYDFNSANGQCYIVMEFVDGYTYSEYLQRKRHVSETDCLLIAESVAAALSYAWNDHGIVHCDLKPENLMINTDGVVKVLDLGVSYRFQFKGDSLQAPSEHVTGTPAYISPEQVYADIELDCRTDIYSLGATLYHLATGRVLFPDCDSDASLRAHCNETSQAKDPRLFRPELSRGFVQLLEAMLVKNRDGRLRDWRDVYAMARAVERGAEFPARETGGNSSLAISSFA